MKRKKIVDVEKELELLEVRLNVYTSLKTELFNIGLHDYYDTDDIVDLNDRIEKAKISCQQICLNLREQVPHIESNIIFRKLIKKHNFEYYSSHFKGGF